MSDAKIYMTVVRNPFLFLSDPNRGREIVELDYVPGRTLMEYAEDYRPSDMPMAYSINGGVTPGLAIPQPGDFLAVCPDHRGGGGGGGGKNPIKTILMLAVVVVAAYVVGPAAAGMVDASLGVGALAGTSTHAFLVSAAGALASAATIAIGGLILNAAFPTPSPDLGGAAVSASDWEAESPTYGWDQSANPQSEGRALPVMFGKVRCTPTIIGKYVTAADDGKQYLNLLLALSEGEDVPGSGRGVVEVEDIYLNGRQIGDYTGVTYEVRPGTVDQSVTDGFGDTVSHESVSRPLKRGEDYSSSKAYAVGDVVWENSVAYEAIAITNAGEAPSTTPAKWRTYWIEIPLFGTATSALGLGAICPYGLYYANNDGGLSQESIYLDVDYKIDGGSWTPWLADYEISGAQREPVTKYWRKDGLAEGKYSVRMRYHRKPSTSARAGTQCTFDFLQEIVVDDFSYPCTALVAIRALATDQLSGGLPRVEVLAKRMTLSVWDGTAWEQKAATNPAWATWSLIQNARYGMGWPKERMLYSEFADWAAWCDEKGLTVNVYIDVFSSGPEALKRTSELGRGTMIQRGMNVGCLADMPADPVQMFSVGNILADSFSQSWLELKDRANVIEITYPDEATEFTRQTVELRRKNLDENTDDVVRQSVSLPGCTSRELAVRHGRFLLNSNEYLLRTAMWKADVDAIACQPGDVVMLQHDLPMWGEGGRVVGCAGTTLTLDKQVTLEPGVSYAVQLRYSVLPAAWDAGTSYLHGAHVVHGGRMFKARTSVAAGTSTSDRTYWAAVSDWFEELPVQSVALQTTTAVLELTRTPAGTVSKFDVYQFGELNRLHDKFRVLSISRDKDLVCTLTALEYNAAVYNDDEVIPPYSTASAIRTQYGITANEVWEVGPDGTALPYIILTWQGMAVSWDVYYREVGGAWVRHGTSSRPRYRIDGLPGVKTYEFSAATGAPDRGTKVQLSVGGKEKIPDALEGLTIACLGNLALLRWQLHQELDVRIGGRVLFRHAPVMSGASWGSATGIGDGVPGGSTIAVLPLKAGSYLARVYDAQGIASEPAIVTTAGATVLEFGPVQSIEEHPQFLGDAVGCAALDGSLRLIGNALVDDIVLIDDVSSLDGLGGVRVGGTYGFSAGMDFTTPRRVRLLSVVGAQCFNVVDVVDAREQPVDDWLDVDGVDVGAADATVWFSETDDDPANPDAVWSDWNRLDAADVFTRGLRFQLRLESRDTDVNIYVSHLAVHAEEVIQ